MKKRSLLFLIGWAALVSLTIAMALPASHYFIVGILRQESFYNGRPTSYWIDALKHEPFARRSAPAQDIGWYLREGGFEALPVLRQMVHDNDAEVSQQARSAISLILRDADSARLSELLSQDHDSQIRLMALHVLAEMQPEPAEKVPTITEALLRDEDPLVRTKAALSLKNTRERIDEAAAALHAALKDPDKNVRFTAASTLAALARHEADIIPLFLEALKEPDGRRSWEAAQALGQMGKRARVALPALEELLQVGDNNAAQHAASLLALIGSREALIETLLRLLKQGTPGARLNAARELQNYAPDAKVAVPVLIELLKIQSTRMGAVAVLSQIGPAAKEAVPGLAEVLKTEKDRRVRLQVLHALRSIARADPMAISVLLRGLDDPDSKVRVVAAMLLWELERQQLDRYRDRVVSVLLALLKDKDEEVASLAAWAVGGENFPAKEAILALRAASNDPRMKVSSAAADALRGIEAREALSSRNRARYQYPSP